MEKIHLYDKIISPIVTEKSTNLSEQKPWKRLNQIERFQKTKVSVFLS